MCNLPIEGIWLVPRDMMNEKQTSIIRQTYMLKNFMQVGKTLRGVGMGNIKINIHELMYITLLL